ncbi:MAG: adenylosuccinate synthase [Clostridiales bacterium]|jgi:adenylosuccinate synthase|nr:adenylosuccinate synthase [Clostridiales bacterium]
MVKAIVGANWGDEGKGKITDLCAAEADIVVRYQGGGNAGHTIINPYGKFTLHQLPSGVFHPNAVNVIANGAALDVKRLLREIKELGSGPWSGFQLKISDRAQLLLAYHVLRDVYEEERLAERRFGSTKSGIAPLYADKYAKQGFQVWQIYDDGDLLEKLKTLCAKMTVEFRHLYGKEPPDPERVYAEMREEGEMIRPFVCDTGAYLRRAVQDNKNILLEGQLGALRDIDHGIYPFVTSSSTLAGYAASGAGIPPYAIQNVLTVTKAYSSAVGEGPFVVEMFGDEAEELRRRGGDAGEYGATTGRPRRVGYFDAVATRYGCAAQGATEAALTGLDVLGYLPEIPVCTAYEIEGKTTSQFPNTALLYKAKPVYTLLPGWTTDIRGADREEKLPDNAKRYIAFLEEAIGVPFTYISTGPKREEIIRRGVPRCQSPDETAGC